MNKLHYIVFLFISLTSCKKDLYFQIEGQVFDGSLNTVLNAADIQIVQVNNDGSVNNTAVYNTITDNNGKFSLNIKREKAIKYLINISKDNYFDEEKSINFSDLSTETPNIVLYQLFAKSWIKFRINNVFPANSSDVFTLNFNDKLTVCNECCIDSKYYYNGNIHDSLICLFKGNQSYFFNYIVSSPFEQKDIEIKTISFDTVTYDFNY
ncbi:MAG: hypothetical protein HYU67_03185 [Flavobacteriia bacterium]|nr:hypothetical protein [Flavobacteriia bacterium]